MSDQIHSDELIRLAEESMPYYEDNGDWKEFNSLRAQLEEMPHTYVLVIAGPEVHKAHIRDIKVDFQSVKGIEYKHIYDHINTRFGRILNDREICVTACLLENIHQHVKMGVGFCVIRIVLEKYKRITVSDNGPGFYNYRKQKRLPVKDAIKSGRSYGSKYKSEGQALATSFDLWTDFATVETPNESVIIVPERTLYKIIKGFCKIIFSLIIALVADLATLVIRENISAADIFIIVSVFATIMNWDRIKLFFGKKVIKKYFPEIKYRIKNKQKFGSVISVYFCDARDMKKWRAQVTDGLKDYLNERAGAFRT